MLRSLRTIRRRRIVLGLVALTLLWVFFNNIPTDVTPVSQRVDPRYGLLRPASPQPGPNSSAFDAQSTGSARRQDYAGPIKFYSLASSLRIFGRARETKIHVLFAFANTKSASHVVTAACGMAHQNRTRVHVAMMGRQELALKDILLVNGISESECPISWHDARCDFSTQSRADRMHYAVGAAFGHINTALRLQATFFDENVREDEFFMSAMRLKAGELGLPLIPLPVNGRESLPWLFSLDGPSLNQWDKAQIDIVVRATSESSGSILRLLRTIKDADYTSLPYPRLTIELPARPDSFLLERLAQFDWPPGTSPVDSKLVIRHRIDATNRSPALSSLSTIESFYPAVATSSHVLILSPHVELSPKYYQFLMFAVLESKYSARMDSISSSVMGVSLDIPTHNLSGDNAPSANSSDESGMLLWQRPGANAVLYFGDKWVEMHKFLLHRLEVDYDLAKTVDQGPKMLNTFPAWLGLALEMMQAQGYYMLYPAHRARNSPLVTIHDELHQPSEEYGDLSTSKKPVPEALPEEDVLTAGANAGSESDAEIPMTSISSIASLVGAAAVNGDDGIWPDPVNLSLFSHDGEQITDWTESQTRSGTYAEHFALSVGGCRSLAARESVKAGTIEYLFCAPGVV